MRFHFFSSRYLIVLSVLLFAARLVGADDRYYMLVFASHGKPDRARFAHTFATFVQVSDAKDGEKQKLTSHTISWLPASLNVVLVRPLAEQGRNLDLEETLKFLRPQNARMAMWGPFRIEEELYRRALRQIEQLNSGAIGYKALDGAVRPGGTATNCIHAVADLDVDAGLLNTGTMFGEAASAAVVRHLQRWIIDPGTTHPEIADRLGLKEYGIEVRGLINPATLVTKDPPARGTSPER